MKKKPKGLIRRSLKRDSGREVIVLIEQVRDEVKLVAEQHGAIVEKLDKVENKLIAHDSSLFKMEMGIEMVKSKTGTIDTKVDRIEKKIDTALAEYGPRLSKLEEKVEV